MKGTTGGATVAPAEPGYLSHMMHTHYRAIEYCGSSDDILDMPDWSEVSKGYYHGHIKDDQVLIETEDGELWPIKAKNVRFVSDPWGVRYVRP